MTDVPAPKKPRKPREKGPFSDELLDELLSHLKGRDAESLLGQSRHGHVQTHAVAFLCGPLWSSVSSVFPALTPCK